MSRTRPGRATASPQDHAALLEIRDLRISITTARKAIDAVNGVDLSIAPGEILALVGESGSGKTMTASAIVGLLPRPAATIRSGAILFEGQDLLRLNEIQRRRLLRQDIAFVVQSSLTSLNPTSTIERQLVDMIAFRNRVPRRQARQQALYWLQEVGIESVEHVMASYPHRLSGGMRQRVLIAMAINSRPKLIIADEPTTALDTATQKQVLSLLQRIRDEHGTAILMITHDFGAVSFLSERVAVMQEGEIVETGPTRKILSEPAHPYTRSLIEAVPRFGYRLAPAPDALAALPASGGSSRPISPIALGA